MSIDRPVDLTEARQLRYMYYSESLPSVIWIVIYAGCVTTLGFGYFFGTRIFESQAIMGATFAALNGLTTLAIGELANPYQGEPVVSSEPFRFVLSSIDAGSRQPPALPPASRR